MEGREGKERSRRRFLHQMGMILTGSLGLSRLAKAMSEEEGELEPLAVPRCPGMPSVVCIGGNYDCDQSQSWFHCINDFTCSPFTCGPSITGDFNCQASPSGNTFTCIDLFRCVGSEPGIQFTCENNVTFDCTGAPQAFYCDPGDFNCSGTYRCNGNPGGAYAMPIHFPPIIGP